MITCVSGNYRHFENAITTECEIPMIYISVHVLACFVSMNNVCVCCKNLKPRQNVRGQK